jgi:hypothetical protein
MEYSLSVPLIGLFDSLNLSWLLSMLLGFL